MVTNLTVTPAGAVAKAISLGLLQPAEALLEAATNFKDLLTATKNRDLLNTAIAFTNTKLGELLPVDSLWQSRVIQPLTQLLANPLLLLHRSVAS